MSSRRYFEKEMRYLREAGQTFAQAHPDQARFLNVDSVADRDPYVERLFEGVAFLTGRVHERLDDELPQYTEGLLSLLHPHFLKPMPSLTIVAFEPKPGAAQETCMLETGTEVRSAPVGPERTTCRFQTAQPVRVQPLALREAQVHRSSDGTSSARLCFALTDGADFDALTGLDLLRLYFHADAALASTMHRFFTRHVRAVTFRETASGRGRPPAPASDLTLRGQRWVQPVGFARASSLLPYGPHTFQAFRLLHEYLCFPRRFWFADVRGLERFQPSDDVQAFDVEVHFDRAYPEDKHFRAENVRLGCAPAVNLFDEDAEPIRLEGLMPDYRVVPSTRRRRSVQTYDVRTVTGVEDETGRRHAYTPFFSFAHHVPSAQPGGANRRSAGGRTFTTARRAGPSGQPEVYLTLGAGGSEDPARRRAETLSVEVRCTNGVLPREALQEGMLDRLAPECPDIATPHNLTRPTLQLEPPGRGRFLWELVSHLSLNHLTVASREALAGLLSLYDWTRTEANARRLEGLKDVRWAPKEILHAGGVLRGTEVTVEVQQGHFADEGDLCLFGMVLSRFLSLYATLNSFVHLKIVVRPSGQEYQWTPPRGTQPLL